MMHRIILRAAFFTFIGCNNPKIEVEKLPTPETFNDSQPSLKIASRYYDYGDLIQELYAELVLNEKEILISSVLINKGRIIRLVGRR